MPSKQENVVQPAYSPVLFMNVDGEPMSFFLRPGPTKRKLQPLITAGGGRLSNVQQPGVILLMDPEERSSIPESTSHWYVSIQYIHDCIEKNEQLDLEDYRLNPGVVQRSSARLNRSKESSPRLPGGRLPYTPEDDAAILNYVSKHKTETGGNRLWQQMEKQDVTSHSWQSMKYRYKVLAKKQSPVVHLKTTEDNKATEEETECMKKTKSAVKSALQKDTTPNEPPSKKARGGSVEAAAESQPEQNGDATVSETAPADESDSVPQKAEKKKEKRKLGILELATKEFEDESESDEAPDLPPETEATSTEPSVPPPPDTAADPASPQSNPERASSHQENVQEAHASSSNSVAETSCPKPAATEPAAVSEAANAQFNAHLFIFDSESQEEDSQSIVGGRPATASNPEPLVNKDAAFSLTQTQLEEDKQRIRELMNQTGQDLVSVTKALLKTSGDFTAALDLLLNPSSISGPFWNRCDDNLLLSVDPVVRQQLQEKYGEESVAKRIVFLEVV
uniref:Telomeric repeat-binding factor 2-interacting protein 1 n=1 Tax=Amphiprion ocellaris TaxID=80972 RepID=A0AAQ6A7V9_AMPOC